MALIAYPYYTICFRDEHIYRGLRFCPGELNDVLKTPKWRTHFNLLSKNCFFPSKKVVKAATFTLVLNRSCYCMSSNCNIYFLFYKRKQLHVWSCKTEMRYNGTAHNVHLGPITTGPVCGTDDGLQQRGLSIVSLEETVTVTVDVCICKEY